jgi:hypothetical protein
MMGFEGIIGLPLAAPLSIALIDAGFAGAISGLVEYELESAP